MKAVGEKYLVDINQELGIIEGYYCRVFPIGSGLRFLPGRRYPLNRTELVRGNITDKMVRYHNTVPWLCVGDISRCILHNIYQQKYEVVTDNIMFALFKRNKLIRGGGKCFIEDEWLSFDTFIRPEVLFSMSKMEKEVFEDCMDSIMDKVIPYTLRYPHNVFNIDTETNYVFIHNLGEIGTYRYFEFVEWRAANG